MHPFLVTARRVLTSPTTQTLLIVGLTILVDKLNAKKTRRKPQSDHLVRNVIKQIVDKYGK